jgi:probable HAF family extracellular repeat protein
MPRGAQVGSLIVLLLLGWAVAPGRPVAHAQAGTPQYTIVDIGTLGGTRIRPFAINASGQVVGNAELPTGVRHAFLYSNGTLTDLGTLGGLRSSAHAINAAGEISGNSDTADGALHSYMYRGGTMIDLRTLGGTNSSGFEGSLNDAGQVVGFSDIAGDAASHPFLYSGGTMIDLGTLGGPTGEASRINASGQVTGGASTLSGQSHAFLYSGGSMTDLGTIGGSFSFGTAINASGQVTGIASTPGDAETRAFLYNNGMMINLGSLGVSSAGFAINDSGQVLGFLETSDGPRLFLYSNGSMIDIGTLGGSRTDAERNTLNGSGQVTGWSFTAGDVEQHGFLYSNGTIYDLNSLIPANSGWVLHEGTAINDRGQITGIGTIDGEVHAFLMTPVRAPYVFRGFFSPVHNGILNSGNAGRAIPMKFSLAGDVGPGVLEPGFPKSVPVTCDTLTPIGALTETRTPGSNGLVYDPDTGQYEYVWKTDGTWDGCRQFVLKLTDGSTHTASFQFK